MSDEFHRIRRLPPYVFAEVNAAKAKARAAGEFTSLSKTYSMPGWRMGFAAGNPRLITALTRMKSYLGYGAFTPIQVTVAPGIGFGEQGDSHVRIAFVENTQRLRQALRAIRGFLQVDNGSPAEPALQGEPV